MKPTILIELNEINFDFLHRYIARGKLPNFRRLIEGYGVHRTTSETKYEHLEPWIQWVTAHTGMSFAEHGVFRLGDIVDTDYDQIWEFLERKGLKVGAISPMNAQNRLSQPAFFIPDPWTNTPVSGGILLQKLSTAISQAVNDNATSKIGFRSMLWLAVAILRFVPLSQYKRYFSLLLSIVKKNSWAKAQILDELLSDVAVSEIYQKRPDFTSVFFNAGAHIQHHYMFNSQVYDGSGANPEWLIHPDQDPVYDVYSQYDEIIGKFLKIFPAHRLMIATGLHQDPFPYVKYYWRLRNHAEFLKKMGVDFMAVEPRMSRDFLIRFNGVDQALRAESKLKEIVASDGVPLFEVDNRGDNLFVMLTYSHEIEEHTTAKCKDLIMENFLGDVVFVAIKNGEHNGDGFLIDTGDPAFGSVGSIPLQSLPMRIARSYGLQWPSNGQSNQSHMVSGTSDGYDESISMPAGNMAIAK